jgi:hypothetical protein
MHSLYTFIAFDLARERVREAEQARLASLRQPVPARTSRVRRAIARAAIAVARVADRDLRVSLSPR